MAARSNSLADAPPGPPAGSKAALAVLVVALLGGCATGARQLMPTPTLYQLPDGQPVLDPAKEVGQSPDLDLLYITDRAPQTAAEAEETGLTFVEAGVGASADTLKGQGDVAGFSFGQEGLMAGWSAKGTKFTRVEPDK